MAKNRSRCPVGCKQETRIEKLRSYKGTLSYCGKIYMSKTGIIPSGNCGCVWSNFNKTKYGRNIGGRCRVIWVNPEHAAEWFRVLEWAETPPALEPVIHFTGKEN